MREFYKDAVKGFSVSYNPVGDIGQITRSFAFCLFFWHPASSSIHVFFILPYFRTLFMLPLFVFLNGWTISMVLTIYSFFFVLTGFGGFQLLVIDDSTTRSIHLQIWRSNHPVGQVCRTWHRVRCSPRKRGTLLSMVCPHVSTICLTCLVGPSFIWYDGSASESRLTCKKAQVSVYPFNALHIHILLFIVVGPKTFSEVQPEL